MSQHNMPNSREASHDTLPSHEQLTPVDPPLRLLAHLIDVGFITVIYTVLVLCFAIATKDPVDYVYSIPFFGLMITFIVSTHYWSRSTTFGKSIMGLYVVDSRTGQPLGVSYMFLRQTIGKLVISPCIFSLGFIWILIDKDKQGWHDKFVNSIVVKRPKPE